MSKFGPVSSPVCCLVIAPACRCSSLPSPHVRINDWRGRLVHLCAAGVTIYPPEPAGRPGVCAVCRGPAGPGFARCYQCGQHDLLGRGLLADAVVPISYAVKGTAFAAGLWRYKSWRPPDPAARTALLALLLTFLHDHGRCVWRHAGMPAPGRLAVVPTGCGRPGPHPLLEMAAPYLRLPVTGLVIRPGRAGP